MEWDLGEWGVVQHAIVTPSTFVHRVVLCSMRHRHAFATVAFSVSACTCFHSVPNTGVWGKLNSLNLSCVYVHLHLCREAALQGLGSVLTVGLNQQPVFACKKRGLCLCNLCLRREAAVLGISSVSAVRALRRQAAAAGLNPKPKLVGPRPQVAEGPSWDTRLGAWTLPFPGGCLS
jgi:hypothetical protein